MSFVHFLEYTFISNTFINNTMLKMANAKQHPEATLFIHEIIRLIIMKMKMNMKNRSHRYNINRARSRHGQKYSKSVNPSPYGDVYMY